MSRKLRRLPAVVLAAVGFALAAPPPWACGQDSEFLGESEFETQLQAEPAFEPYPDPNAPLDAQGPWPPLTAEPIAPPPEQSRLGQPPLDDPQLAVEQPYVDPLHDSCDACGDCPPINACPINWISGPYLKAGTTFILGSGLLDDNREAGYTISGGYRQPFGPGLAGDRVFLDVGGSYLSAFGTTLRNTVGRQVTFGGVETLQPNSFATTLDEVKRASVHAALGWYWGDSFDDASLDPQFRIATRLGGRFGHIRGSFSDIQLRNPPAGGAIFTIYDQTDRFGGVFVGAEAILLDRQSLLGNAKVTVELEFANDWVNLSAFESGNLTTASLMLGYMLSR